MPNPNAPAAPLLPSPDDVIAAARLLSALVHHTPTLTSRSLDEETGARFFFKCENLQRTGAFKFRGACNAVHHLTPGQRAAGVITFSSGNHAQAIALACGMQDIPATIVMPSDAPAGKLQATRGYGAQVVLYDRYTDDREHITRALMAQHGQTFIPPYDHPHIIAGQGTAAAELFGDVGQLDALFVPVGGGGLIAGSALATRALSAGCRVYGAEPATGDDARRSLHTGQIVHIEPPRTIADGAQTQHVGRHPFAIIQREVTDILAVTDQELIDCMRFFAQRMKLLVEPTGCLGLAAALGMQGALRGQRIGVIISGGNVDLERFSALVSQGTPLNE